MRAIINRGGAGLRRTACALAVLLASGSAGAVTLQGAYQAALKNDPTFRMNFYENEAGKENAVLGRSNLLPSVSASFSTSRNIADQEVYYPPNPPLFAGGWIPSQPRYMSRSSVVQLRQPILNLDGVARYRQGKVMAKQSQAQFEANTNEVAIRVVGAYFDALFADDQAALARVNRDMYAEQQKVNQRLFEKGEGTKTDMLETRARMDLAEAQLVEAQDNAVAARDSLAGIIGGEPGSLDQLRDDFRVGDLDVGPFEKWQKLALANNRELATARLAIENARLEISKDRAGHYPRVDMIATYSKGQAESLNTYNQNSVNRAIGLQVNIPIYSGGAVNATVRQAAAGYERAQADLDARTAKAMVDLRKAYDVVQSSVHKIEALVKAVESGTELMKATEQSIKGGVRINLDLLNAQQQLYTSRRDLAQARYSYLLGVLRLHALSGQIGNDDVRLIAAYLKS
ncbi:TolC family outer membrane protein [Massilia terrae]|uniref:TolC family outer membrane protein n=1 Tax=Massilia terrae TaxID=1811224 RepID=A0ABT2CWN3_9BURK|nr:TolC family outer membrane protein [Massilia terrae]MCS0658394.1 TolC family outer membrane protein [Massilia terrae]